MGIASLMGPGLFASTFALGIDPHFGALLPGAPYLLAAAVLAFALAAAYSAKLSDNTT
jgi:hypothetical protein